MLSWDDGDPNIADEIGQTPVHVAAKCGRASSLRLLLRKGGRLDLEDEDGKTPIKHATDECILTIIHHQVATRIGKEISKICCIKIMEGSSYIMLFSRDLYRNVVVHIQVTLADG